MRREVVVATGWVGAVAAAAMFGLAATSALGTGIGPGGPLSHRDVSDRLAQTPSTPHLGPTEPGEPGPEPASTTTPSAAATRQYFTTTGGGMWATCLQGLATLDTMTPRQGFRLDGYDQGPAQAAWVRFKQDVQHGHGDEYQVTISCVNGVPQVQETADQ